MEKRERRREREREREGMKNIAFGIMRVPRSRSRVPEYFSIEFFQSDFPLARLISLKFILPRGQLINSAHFV